MKRTIIIGVALVALITGALWAGGNREADAEPATEGPETREIPSEDLVARVDGQGVTREEFDDLVESNIARYESQSNEPFPAQQRRQLERQVLDGLITRTVLELETEKQGITIGDEQFESTLAQFKSQFPDEDAYRRGLEQQGFTVERFETELRRQLLIEELITTQALDALAVDEADLRAFYEDNPEYFERPEEVAARHIILTTQGISDEGELQAKREQLQDLRRRIVEGEDFATLAREFSEGPSAPDGGRLGTFGRGQMVPEFEDAAFALEVGEISGIVETQFGYHILQVTERMPARVVDFADARANIEEFLLEDSRNEAAQNYVRELRESAEVEELITIE